MSFTCRILLNMVVSDNLRTTSVVGYTYIKINKTQYEFLSFSVAS